MGIFVLAYGLCRRKNKGSPISRRERFLYDKKTLEDHGQNRRKEHQARNVVSQGIMGRGSALSRASQKTARQAGCFHHKISSGSVYRRRILARLQLEPAQEKDQEQPGILDSENRTQYAARSRGESAIGRIGVYRLPVLGRGNQEEPAPVCKRCFGLSRRAALIADGPFTASRSQFFAQGPHLRFIKSDHPLHQFV